jgi:antirestriction protein ArdC
LVGKLREGVVPWRKVWQTGDPTRMPTNYLTRKQYHGGVNKMNLWTAQQDGQFPTGYWATALQWARAGGVIRPGEQPERIVRPIWGKGQFVASGYVPVEVYNLAQVEGVKVDLPTAPATYTPGTRNQFDELVDSTLAWVVHGGDEAMYSYDLDVIFLPHRFRFPDYESYAQTLAHELLHWSETRVQFISDMQFLELRAEIGSSFLLAELGVPTSDDLANHASYIGYWLDEMRDDPGYLQKAAEEASMGVDFLLSFVRAGD